MVLEHASNEQGTIKSKCRFEIRTKVYELCSITRRKNDCSFVPSESLNFIYGSFDIDQVANVNHNALTAICFDISTNCFGLLVLFYEINALC